MFFCCWSYVLSWGGCCFCFCSDQWCYLCVLATGGLFASRQHCHFVFSVIACLSLQLLFVCRPLIWQLIFCHCLCWQMLLKLRRLCESYLLCLGGSCPVGQYLPSWLFFFPGNFRFNGTALYYQMSPASLSVKSIKVLQGFHQISNASMNAPFIECCEAKWMHFIFPGPFLPDFHSLWVRDHSKWTKQWKSRRSWTANRKQFSRSQICLFFRKKDGLLDQVQIWCV